MLGVNALVQAFYPGAPQHREYRAWLESTVASDEPCGLSDLVLSGFVRVATHPRVFDPPAPIGQALAVAEALRTQPNAMVIVPNAGDWEIFDRLCRAMDARGNLVPDAFLAALAIESGSEWITLDRDYRRFPGLRPHHPLAPG